MQTWLVHVMVLRAAPRPVILPQYFKVPAELFALERSRGIPLEVVVGVLILGMSIAALESLRHGVGEGTCT